MTSKRDKNFSVVAFQKSIKRDTFDCGMEALNNYFKKQIGQDARRNVAAPFILVEQDSGVVAGFYTLSMKSILLWDLPQEVIKKLPRYTDVPVALLGRLAVDLKYKGLGLGGVLLYDAMERAYNATSEVAAYAMVVDAKHGAEKFYIRYGFEQFPDQKDRLFMPMNTIEKLVHSQK